MNDLESMIDELRAPLKYTIYKRSLPLPGINKVIAQNMDSYEECLEFIKTMKLKTKVVIEDNKDSVIYFDILPENIPIKDVFYNPPTITTVGNDKKKVAINYMGLE